MPGQLADVLSYVTNLQFVVMFFGQHLLWIQGDPKRPSWGKFTGIPTWQYVHYSNCSTLLRIWHFNLRVKWCLWFLLHISSLYFLLAKLKKYVQSSQHTVDEKIFSRNPTILYEFTYIPGVFSPNFFHSTVTHSAFLSQSNFQTLPNKKKQLRRFWSKKKRPPKRHWICSPARSEVCKLGCKPRRFSSRISRLNVGFLLPFGKLT